jgi:general secretion pathway protein G
MAPESGGSYNDRMRVEARCMGAACAGFTLAELMLVVAIAAVLGAIAVPVYSGYVERARVNQAIIDIRMLNLRARKYEDDHLAVPQNLAAIGAAGMLDPWGRPYDYLKLGGPKTAGMARKNKNLVPINSAFDLYSRGKDGVSLPPLTAQPSLDDVVLANDGGFAGLASDYIQ